MAAPPASSPQDGSAQVAAPAIDPAQASPSNTAQTSETPAATSADIVVTAQRRSQSALSVPAALTVLAGSNLKTLGVVNVADLQNVTPSLEINRTALGLNIALRGVQTSDLTSKGEQDIAFNVDNVYMGRPAEQQLAFFDVDRIEVLRGPQGTLYGRSATAGAINVVTNAPQLGSYAGYLEGTYGNYNTRRTEGAVNLPLGDTVAIRLAGVANLRDGFSPFYSQTVTTATGSYPISATGLPAHNDESNVAGRASLLFKPDDGFSVRLTAVLGKLGGTGPTSVDYDNLVAANFGPAGLALPADPVPAYVHERFALYSADIVKRLGFFQLTLIGSHQAFNMNDQVTSGQNPAVNGNAFKLDQQIENFNTNEAEVRLSNAAPSVVDFTVGANYYRERIRENYHEWEAPVATYADTTTWAPQIEPNNVTTHDSWGLYGQGTWHVTDRLGLVGGARYTHDEVNRVGTFGFGRYAGPCFYPDACTGNNVSANNGHEADNKVTWRAGANYQLTPANLFYASVATGFKGGGFNDIDPTKGIAAGSQPYAPESLTAYEIGYKGRPFRGVTFTSSAFYNDFSAEQIAGSLTYSGQRITFTAVAPTKIYGWENEVTFRLDQRTAISGSASFLHGEYVNFLAGANYGSQVQWAGRSLDKVPTFSGNIAVDRDFALAGGSLIHFRVGTRINSGYYISAPGNTVQFFQDAFTRTDASLSYSPPGGTFLLEAYVRNIENKVQLTGGPDIYFGPNGTAANDYRPGTYAFANGTPFTVSDPRMYGIRLRVKF